MSRTFVALSFLAACGGTSTQNTSDAGTADTSTADTGTADAATADIGVTDTGTTDTSLGDAGAEPDPCCVVVEGLADGAMTFCEGTDGGVPTATRSPNHGDDPITEVLARNDGASLRLWYFGEGTGTFADPVVEFTQAGCTWSNDGQGGSFAMTSWTVPGRALGSLSGATLSTRDAAEDGCTGGPYQVSATVCASALDAP